MASTENQYYNESYEYVDPTNQHVDYVNVDPHQKENGTDSYCDHISNVSGDKQRKQRKASPRCLTWVKTVAVIILVAVTLAIAVTIGILLHNKDTGWLV